MNYTLTLSIDQVGEALRDYGRAAVRNRKPFVMVRFVGPKDKELPELASIFPEGPTTWNLYVNSVTGGRNRFDVTDDTLLTEIEEAVYCGPARASAS